MKNHIKKGISGLCIFTMLSLTACSGNSYTLPQEFSKRETVKIGVAAYEDTITASEIKKTEGGKQYLVSNGRPVMMLGAQLRTDFFINLDGNTIDELDQYFQLAKTLNITMVQVPICWADIEPTKDSYTSEYVKRYIDYCKKYDIKLELLWFGSYMCGYSVVSYVPEYIAEDSKTYPEVSNFSMDGWLGRQYCLVPGTTELLTREKAALAYMMGEIWEYDRMNGGECTVVGIQIENEPDMLITERSHEWGKNMTKEEIATKKEEMLPRLVYHLNELGKVVKESKYSCYTRVNLTDRVDTPYFIEHLTTSEGIDMVGIDPYVNNLSTIQTWLNTLSVNGNYAHVAENGGEFSNNDQMELLSILNGAGYEVFEVVTTPHEKLVDWTLRGVYNTDFTKKEHTQRLIDANKIYRNGWLDLILCEKNEIAGFNLKSKGAMNSTFETAEIGEITIEWKTENGGIAYAVNRNGILTVASTKADTMIFSGDTIVYAEYGYYDMDGIWHKEGEKKIKNNTITTEPTTVYRLLTQTTAEEMNK